MNWYINKIAFESSKFKDRNILNHKISTLEEIKVGLVRSAEVIFQDKVAARNFNTNFMDNKVLSSFPEIRGILLEADRICLDNPWKFADLCSAAVIKLSGMIQTLQQEREAFGQNRLEKLRRKGWWHDGE